MTTSPLPWQVRGQAGYTGHGVNDSSGRSVCAVPSNGNLPHDIRNANVELIVKAANNHAALVAAAIAIRELLYTDGRLTFKPEYQQLLDAIAAAKSV